MALVLNPARRDPRPAHAPRTLPDRLRTLAVRRRRASLTQALARLAALALVLAAAVMALDFAARFADPWRAGCLAALVVTLGVAARRRVLPALALPATPQSAARLLEDAYPRFQDALASAVDFLSAARPGSLRFRQVAVIRAENAYRKIDPEVIVPSRPARRSLMLLFAVVTVAGGLAAWQPAVVRAAVLRLFDPLGRHRYPTRTTVEFLDPPARLARGEPYPVRLKLGGVRPDLVTLEIQSPDGLGTIEESLPVPAVAEPDEPIPEVRSAVDASRVARSFRVRALAGDGESEWHGVTVAPAPRLVPRDGRASPQVRVVPPAYTRLPPVQLPDGAGVVEAVAGSAVTLSARCDRRIVRATLTAQSDRATDRLALAAAPAGFARPLQALCAQLLADEHLADVPVGVSGDDSTDLDVTWTPYHAGLVTLRFEDETGLAGTRLFDFRMLPDPVPLVTLARPDPVRDPLLLLPGADFPLEAQAIDRLYAVRDLTLQYRVGPGEWRALPLTAWEPSAGHAGLVGATATAGPQPQELAAARRLAVAELADAQGNPPADGTIVTVRAAARDFDDRTALKPPGRSPEVELRILEAPALEATFQKELAAARPDLLRLREQLREAAERVEVEANKPAPDPVALTQAEQSQRQVRNQVASPGSGLRDRLDRLRRTAEANRLPASATTDKLGRVARGLDRLADGQLESAESAVAAAKLAAATPDRSPPDAKGLLAEAARKQSAARQTVDDTLAALEEWGGAGEVQGAARGLQEQVQRAADALKGSPNQTEEAASRLAQAAEGSAELLTRASRLAQEKDAKAADAAARGDDTAAKLAAAEAEALREGVGRAGGDALTADLRRAAEATRAGQTASAEQSRQSALDRLERLADPLAAPPPPPAGADQKALAAELDELAEDQALLRKKAKQVEATADPEQRQEQFAELAQEQENLRRQAERLAERLTRERPEVAAELRRAAESQDAARDALERGESPVPDQESVLDKVDAARNAADSAKPEDKLDREQQEQLKQKLAALRDDQKAALGECDRIQETLLANAEWDRGLLVSLQDLADREAAFAKTLRRHAAEDFQGLVVFAKLLDQAATAAEEGAGRLTRRSEEADPLGKIDPVGEGVQHRLAREPVARSLARLELLAGALDQKTPKPQKPQVAAATDPPPDGGEPPEQPPAEAAEQAAEAQKVLEAARTELKVLRALQAEVAGRTRELAGRYPSGKPLPADAKAELAELERTQRDIAGLFAQIAERLAPQPEAKP